MGMKVKFSNKFLNDLVHDCNSGIVLEANRTKYVNVSPFQLQNLTGFIREYLNSLVATYDPELSGIILSHQKIKVNPEFNVEGDGTNKLLYIADIYVFRPKIGSVLTGVVNQKSKDHVGCLVHRVFNVTIPKPDGDEEEEEVWNRTSVGQDVRFRVVAFDMTLKIPSIHGQILESSTPQSSNALDLDHCLQEALDSQSESVKSDESDIKNDHLSNSCGVKSQKSNVVQGISSENIDNNRLNVSSSCKASLDKNTDRTSPSSRKCVEDSKNKRNHLLSLSLRVAKDVHTEIDSDSFIPPSPVKQLKRSISVEKVSKDLDKEGTNFSKDEFEKTEEEKSAFNVSTSNITFRTRKNNLWINDETFGNVSSFLKNLDSPQSCLRRSESPSSSNNSPATSDKHNRSVRFSSHDSVLRFDANTKRNSITQEKSKSRNSSGSPEKLEVPEKKLSETIKSPPRSASPTKVLKSDKLGEINKTSSEHRKSSLTQTIVSKSSESRNIGRESDSESTSDDSLVGMSENRKSPLTQTIISKSSGNVSRNSESNSSSKDSLLGLPEKRKSSLTQTIVPKSSESRDSGRDSDSDSSSDDSLVEMSENRKSPLTQTILSKSSGNVSRNSESNSSSKDSLLGLPEKRKSSLTQTIVSKSSESRNIGRNSDSESSSDDSLVGMSENRKSPLTQTIVSKRSEKSGNVGRKPESDSSSDESLKKENEGVSQTRFMDSSKHTGVSTDFHSTFYEKLEKEGKRKERPSDETNSSDTSENSDSDGKIERKENKLLTDVKSPVKDVKTPKTSLTPRRDSVTSIPASKIDESFEKRRKMFLENTKSPEKRREVLIVTETKEKLDSNNKLGRLESVGGLNTSDVATVYSDREVHGESKRKSDEKERQKLMSDDSEKEEAQNMVPDETDSKIRTSNATIKSTSNSSSIKGRHSILGFNLDDETPKRTRRDSEKHDDDRRRVSGSRIMEVQSANIFDERQGVLKSSSKSPVSSGYKVHDSLERNSMSKEGNPVDCGRNDSMKVSDVINDEVGSPEKAIRERAASICEESTVTMLLKDAFSKFWGSKNRKSSGAKEVDSVDASTVEDSNQDTDLDQTCKKSGKVKRKSIEAFVKPAENLDKHDFRKESNVEKKIENSTRKSVEKKRKSFDSNVKSAENEAKIVHAKTSSEDENLDKLITKIEDAKRKSLDRNVSTVVSVPENASTLKDTNQDADSDRIAKKVKKKKSKERELDKRKSIEEEGGNVENLKQESRDCSLSNSYLDTDVEKLSKMEKKKKKHKDRDLEDRESKDILLKENMNLSLQDSKEEVDLVKKSEKAKKKKKKEKELDVGKAEELCATEECIEQEIVNRDSSVQDSNQERDRIKRVKKKKKRKENEKAERVLEPYTTENVDVEQEIKNNDLPVIDVVSSELNLEKLPKKMKKKKKKKEKEDEGENQEDIHTKSFAVDSNQCPDVEKLSKNEKKSRKKEKELEDLNKSSILLDSNNESSVQEMPKKEKRKKKKPKDMESHFTKEGGEKKINDTRNQFNLDFANRSTLDTYIADYNSSEHKTKKTSHLKAKYDGYHSEIEQRAPVSMISNSGSVKKHKSKKYFENSVSHRGDESSIDSKYRTIEKGNEKPFGDKIFVNDCQNENKKFKKRKSDQKIVEDSSLLRNQEEMGGGSKQGIHLEKKEDSFHKKKHRDSLVLEGSPGMVRSLEQFGVDGYLTDCKYSKHKSKKKSSFKTKRDGYASDFEVNKKESRKIDEDLRKKNKLEKFSKFEDKRRNSTLDGYVTDCHSSRDKSKKKTSSKLKRDGDFETSLRIPNWEEVMSKKNKHKKKNSIETSKTSIEKEAEVIGDVSAHEHSRTQIESHKTSRKRKTSHNSESNNDHCAPTKKIKVTESSSFSESGITDNRTASNHENERSSITREQKKLSESFEEGDQSVRVKRKRTRGKKRMSSINLEKSLSTDNISVDKVLTKKKNKESREQDIISAGISRKRKISDIGKTGDGCSVPTKKSKTMPSPSHEMGGGISRNINKDGKEEQNINSNKEHDILQRGKPVVEDVGENRKKKHIKSRDTSFEMSKKFDEQSLKGESLKEEKMSRKSSEGPPSNSCSDVPKDVKSTDSTSNRSLVAVDNISKTPKKSAEKASRRKTPKKSAEDPKQLKMLKYFSPVKKIHPTQEISLSTDNNLRQYSNVETNSNPSNEASAEKTTSNVKKMLSFPVEKDKKSEEVSEKTSKKKKKKRKGDDLLDLQQEMINRLLESK